jgi:hypothetical protein
MSGRVQSAMDRKVCQNDVRVVPFRRHLPHALSEKSSTGGGDETLILGVLACLKLTRMNGGTSREAGLVRQARTEA